MKPQSLLHLKKGEIVEMIDPVLLAVTDPQVGMEGVIEERTVHCFDQWLIVKVQPGREAMARASLVREGFECWYPAGRRMKRLPQRFISSKTRHKKRAVLIEELRLPYPGYVFIRRLKPASQRFELHKLYELNGLIGLCMFGDLAAYIEDYEIQMLRFKEDIGTYDIWDVDMTAKQFGLAEIRRTEAAKQRWDKPPAVVGTLDSNQGRRIHLVEAFGRITRVLAGTGPGAPAGAKSLAQSFG